MKLLHRMTLQMLPGPFFGCLGTLMFLLLLQFLMRYLPDLVGKGLPLRVIVELIMYNLAYMVVLAVPMAVLISTVLAGGKLAESQAYTVVKNAGISFFQLSWPVYVVGLLLMGGMMYFNNIVLPEANFRAKSLWLDIRRTRPTVELQEGRFYTGLQGYSIRAEQVESETGALRDVVIFDHRDRQPAPATITARTGTLETRQSGERLVLALREGELHRFKQEGAQEPQYERLRFDRYLIRFDISNLTFERRGLTSGSRTDRTMRTPEMWDYIDSLETAGGSRRSELLSRVRDAVSPEEPARAPPPEEESSSQLPVPTDRDTADGTDRDSVDGTDRDTAGDGAPAPTVSLRGSGSTPTALRGIAPQHHRRIYGEAVENARSLRSRIESAANNMQWYQRRANRYRVEVHKKFSIAFACVIFAIIGLPLGVAVKRGSIGVASGVSATIFLFYWVTLVQGEKMADRGFIDPWIGMWAANVVVGVLAVGVTWAVALDRTGEGFFQRGARLVRRLVGK